MCIHILFIFRFSRQITSCQISCPAITIIKDFLQIFIAVQYLCYITSTRWGCFLGLKAVCNFSIDCKQASKIISNITWIINSSPLCQCNCGTAACSSFSRRQYHHISLFYVLFQFFDCLCRCIFFGCFNFYICVVLHRRIRIIFRFCIRLLFLSTIFFRMCLTFCIRQSHFPGDGIAVTLIFWNDHISGNICSCFVRMILSTILIFDTYKRNIFFFCIIMDSFHTGFHCKCFIRNRFCDIICCNRCIFLACYRLYFRLLFRACLFGRKRIRTAQGTGAHQDSQSKSSNSGL